MKLKPEIIEKIRKDKKLKKDLVHYFGFVDYRSLTMKLDANSSRLTEIGSLVIIGDYLNMLPFEMLDK